jgi:hypothetical protein
LRALTLWLPHVVVTREIFVSRHSLVRRTRGPVECPSNGAITYVAIPWALLNAAVTMLQYSVMLDLRRLSYSHQAYSRACARFGPALYNMGFRFSDTWKGASVLLLTSSTVTPSAISIRVNPWAKSTSNTP